MTDENSFANVRNWMRQIDQNASANVNRILIGNKCDCDAKERVSVTILCVTGWCGSCTCSVYVLSNNFLLFPCISLSVGGLMSSVWFSFNLTFYFCPVIAHEIDTMSHHQFLNLLLQKVTAEQGNGLASEFGLKFFETSAKANVNVDKAFVSIASDIVERLKINPDHYGSEGGMNLNKDKSKAGANSAKGGCC